MDEQIEWRVKRGKVMGEGICELAKSNCYQNEVYEDIGL